jgi:hypothetical protein
MGAGTAEIKIFNRSSIFCPTGDRTKEEELIQSELALKNISFGEAEFLFQIPWRHHLAMKNDVFQVWCIFTQRIDHRIASASRLSGQLPVFRS